MSQLKAFSLLTEDVVDVGLPSEDGDYLGGLGDLMASGRDSLIVFVDGPAIREWDGTPTPVLREWPDEAP